MTKTVEANATAEQEINNVPQEAIKNLNGVGGDYLIEKYPSFFKLQNEKLIEKGNSYIVLGRDRFAGALSGYGGKGHAKSSCIDMVVGRLSCVTDEEGTTDRTKWTNPDFKNDAARIYISQKTDIDKNFDLPEGKVGISSAKSGIAIKADSVRLIARSGIKLISSNDSIDSMGLNIAEKKGIDLIAGVPYDSKNNEINNRYQLARYKDDMQPIPKGINLLEALKDIADQLDQISGVLATFVNIQMSFNNHVAAHTHIENFYGLPGYPSNGLIGPMVETNVDIFEQTVNDLLTFKLQYLNYFNQTYLSLNSTKYINSRYHNLN